jgi:hypothetical protein
MNLDGVRFLIFLKLFFCYNLSVVQVSKDAKHPEDISDNY